MLKILEFNDVRTIVRNVAKIKLKQKPKIATCNVISAPSNNRGNASII